MPNETPEPVADEQPTQGPPGGGKWLWDYAAQQYLPNDDPPDAGPVPVPVPVIGE